MLSPTNGKGTDNQNQSQDLLALPNPKVLNPKNALPAGIADALGPKKDGETTKENKEEDKDKFIEISPDSKTTVVFQFLYNPEYVGVGNPIVINMDTFKAFGTITKLYPDKIDQNLTHEVGSKSRKGSARKVVKVDEAKKFHEKSFDDPQVGGGG